MTAHEDVFDAGALHVLVDPLLEMSVLGLALYRGCPLSGVRAEHFWYASHTAVYGACAALAERGEAVDVGTVLEHLSSTGALAQFGRPLDFLDWWNYQDPLYHGRDATAHDVQQLRELAALRRLRDLGLAVAAAAERCEPHAAREPLARAADVVAWLMRQARTESEAA